MESFAQRRSPFAPAMARSVLSPDAQDAPFIHSGSSIRFPLPARVAALVTCSSCCTRRLPRDIAGVPVGVSTPQFAIFNFHFSIFNVAVLLTFVLHDNFEQSQHCFCRCLRFLSRLLTKHLQQESASWHNPCVRPLRMRTKNSAQLLSWSEQLCAHERNTNTPP